MKPKAGKHRKRKWLIILFVSVFTAYFFGVYAPSMGVYSLSDIFPIEPIPPTSTEQAESDEQQQHQPILQEEEKEEGAASEAQQQDDQQQEQTQQQEEEEN
ncbi:MAG TPA: hypothetical protein VHF46_01120, partial [Rubrobacteraceae bacterium]|nr:hypothetical protein [Rubrobacteraceae bacterium]